MARFQYRPIDQERRSFRLVQLLAAHEGVIRCQLFDAWLDDPDGIIEYEALSYTWGETQRTSEVEMDGDWLVVTKNLWSALQALRHPSQDRILWIDAVCIDQDNELERGHQVLQMASIYKKAEQVIVWLGKSDHDTDMAFDYMLALDSEASKHFCKTWTATDERWRGLSTSLSCELSSYHTNGFKDLFHRPWFNRVWVLQEVANARAAKMLCGTRSASTRIFAIMPLVLQTRLEITEHCQAVLDVMPGPIRRYSWWSQKRDLRTLLLKFRASEASDMRDKIYALLGICVNTNNASALNPDYTKSVEATVQDTISFLLNLPQSRAHDLRLPRWTMAELLDKLLNLEQEVLLWASIDGIEETLAYLLDYSEVDVDSVDENGRTCLFYASARGHGSIVRRLILTADPKIKDKFTWNPLWMAAANGHQTVVDLFYDVAYWNMNFDPAVTDAMLEASQNDNTEKWRREKPLCWAVYVGSIQLVSLLLDLAIYDVDVETLEMESLIRWTAINGDEELLGVILEASNIHVKKSNDDIKSLLLWAISEGEDAKAIAIIRSGKAGITANLGDSSQYSAALIRAAISGRDAVIRTLLEIPGTGSQIRICALAAVTEAIKNRSTCSVETLLENEEVKDVLKQPDVRAPLYEASSTNQPDMVAVVLKYCNLSGRKHSGDEAISNAVDQGCIEIIKMLLEAALTLDLNRKHTNGSTLLDRAVRRGRDDVVAILLETKQVDVNCRTHTGQTPLWRAAWNGSTEIVAMLLSEPDVELDSQDSVYGQTPLAIASESGRTEVVRLLLETGKVDILSKDRDGRTPADSAKRYRHAAVQELLGRYAHSRSS